MSTSITANVGTELVPVGPPNEGSRTYNASERLRVSQISLLPNQGVVLVVQGSNLGDALAAEITVQFFSKRHRTYPYGYTVDQLGPQK